MTAISSSNRLAAWALTLLAPLSGSVAQSKPHEPSPQDSSITTGHEPGVALKHTIVKGDTLGAIAKDTYGDSRYWKEIVKANPGLDPQNLKIGDEINLPRLGPDAPIPDLLRPERSHVSPTTYLVQKGQTLSHIARELFNDANRWPEIAAANGLKPPYRLTVGQKLTIPGGGGEICDQPNPVPEFIIYRVKAGDNPTKIALKVLGDSALVGLIMDANPAIDATKLQEGQELLIPVLGKSVEQSGDCLVAPRPSHALAEHFFEQLSKSQQTKLTVKLNYSKQPSVSGGILELAADAGINFSPDGIREFQRKQGLKDDGKIGPNTSKAIYRTILARWYEQQVAEHSQHTLSTAPGQVSCVVLRGFDFDSGAHDNRAKTFNDTVAFIWRDANGRWHVAEFRCTADPGLNHTTDRSTDINGDGKGDVAFVPEGKFNTTPGPHKGKPGALRFGTIRVHRDINGNGYIDGSEADKLYLAHGVNLHWSSASKEKGVQSVGGFSIGCITLAQSRGNFLKHVTPLFDGVESVPVHVIDLGNPSRNRK